jgi:hypothetical protein
MWRAPPPAMLDQLRPLFVPGLADLPYQMTHHAVGPRSGGFYALVDLMIDGAGTDMARDQLLQHALASGFE